MLSQPSCLRAPTAESCRRAPGGAMLCHSPQRQCRSVSAHASLPLQPPLPPPPLPLAAWGWSSWPPGTAAGPARPPPPPISAPTPPCLPQSTHPHTGSAQGDSRRKKAACVQPSRTWQTAALHSSLCSPRSEPAPRAWLHCGVRPCLPQVRTCLGAGECMCRWA